MTFLPQGVDPVGFYLCIFAPVATMIGTVLMIVSMLSVEKIVPKRQQATESKSEKRIPLKLDKSVSATVRAVVVLGAIIAAIAAATCSALASAPNSFSLPQFFLQDLTSIDLLMTSFFIITFYLQYVLAGTSRYRFQLVGVLIALCGQSFAELVCGIRQLFLPGAISLILRELDLNPSSTLSGFTSMWLSLTSSLTTTATMLNNTTAISMPSIATVHCVGSLSGEMFITLLSYSSQAVRVCVLLIPALFQLLLPLLLFVSCLTVLIRMRKTELLAQLAEAHQQYSLRFPLLRSQLVHNRFHMEALEEEINASPARKFAALFYSLKHNVRVSVAAALLLDFFLVVLSTIFRIMTPRPLSLFTIDGVPGYLRLLSASLARTTFTGWVIGNGISIARSANRNAMIAYSWASVACNVLPCAHFLLGSGILPFPYFDTDFSSATSYPGTSRPGTTHSYVVALTHISTILALLKLVVSTIAGFYVKGLWGTVQILDADLMNGEQKRQNVLIMRNNNNVHPSKTTVCSKTQLPLDDLIPLQVGGMTSSLLNKIDGTSVDSPPRAKAQIDKGATASSLTIDRSPMRSLSSNNKPAPAEKTSLDACPNTQSIDLDDTSTTFNASTSRIPFRPLIGPGSTAEAMEGTTCADVSIIDIAVKATPRQRLLATLCVVSLAIQSCLYILSGTLSCFLVPTLGTIAQVSATSFCFAATVIGYFYRAMSENSRTKAHRQPVFVTSIYCGMNGSLTIYSLLQFVVLLVRMALPGAAPSSSHPSSSTYSSPSTSSPPSQPNTDPNYARQVAALLVGIRCLASFFSALFMWKLQRSCNCFLSPSSKPLHSSSSTSTKSTLPSSASFPHPLPTEYAPYNNNSSDHHPETLSTHSTSLDACETSHSSLSVLSLSRRPNSPHTSQHSLASLHRPPSQCFACPALDSPSSDTSLPTKSIIKKNRTSIVNDAILTTQPSSPITMDSASDSAGNAPSIPSTRLSSLVSSPRQNDKKEQFDQYQLERYPNSHLILHSCEESASCPVSNHHVQASVLDTSSVFDNTHPTNSSAPTLSSSRTPNTTLCSISTSSSSSLSLCSTPFPTSVSESLLPFSPNPDIPPNHHSDSSILRKTVRFAATSEVTILDSTSIQQDGASTILHRAQVHMETPRIRWVVSALLEGRDHALIDEVDDDMTTNGSMGVQEEWPEHLKPGHEEEWERELAEDKASWYRKTNAILNYEDGHVDFEAMSKWGQRPVLRERTEETKGIKHERWQNPSVEQEACDDSGNGTDDMSNNGDKENGGVNFYEDDGDKVDIIATMPFLRRNGVLCGASDENNADCKCFDCNIYEHDPHLSSQSSHQHVKPYHHCNGLRQDDHRHHSTHQRQHYPPHHCPHGSHSNLLDHPLRHHHRRSRSNYRISQRLEAVHRHRRERSVPHWSLLSSEEDIANNGGTVAGMMPDPFLFLDHSLETLIAAGEQEARFETARSIFKRLGLYFTANEAEFDDHDDDDDDGDSSSTEGTEHEGDVKCQKGEVEEELKREERKLVIERSDDANDLRQTLLVGSEGLILSGIDEPVIMKTSTTSDYVPDQVSKSPDYPSKVWAASNICGLPSYLQFQRLPVHQSRLHALPNPSLPFSSTFSSPITLEESPSSSTPPMPSSCPNPLLPHFINEVTPSPTSSTSSTLCPSLAPPTYFTKLLKDVVTQSLAEAGILPVHNLLNKANDDIPLAQCVPEPSSTTDRSAINATGLCKDECSKGTIPCEAIKRGSTDDRTTNLDLNGSITSLSSSSLSSSNIAIAGSPPSQSFCSKSIMYLTKWIKILYSQGLDSVEDPDGSHVSFPPHTRLSLDFSPPSECDEHVSHVPLVLFVSALGFVVLLLAQGLRDGIDPLAIRVDTWAWGYDETNSMHVISFSLIFLCCGFAFCGWISGLAIYLKISALTSAIITLNLAAAWLGSMYRIINLPLATVLASSAPLNKILMKFFVLSYGLSTNDLQSSPLSLSSSTSPPSKPNLSASSPTPSTSAFVVGIDVPWSDTGMFVSMIHSSHHNNEDMQYLQLNNTNSLRSVVWQRPIVWLCIQSPMWALLATCVTTGFLYAAVCSWKKAQEVRRQQQQQQQQQQQHQNQHRHGYKEETVSHASSGANQSTLSRSQLLKRYSGLTAIPS